MKQTFIARPIRSDQMSLQITSMADIFMILLVFLLKSYGTGLLEITPSRGLTLPSASAEASTTDALKVEVSRSGVLVEGRPVAMMRDFSFDKRDIDGNGASKSVSSALAQERLKTASKKVGGVPESRIIVVADRDAPYSSIKTVLAAASETGYTDFKLAVVQRD